MSTDTTASAAAVPAVQESAPAPVPVVATPTETQTPVKSANDIVNASGEDLATRYGLAALDAPAETEAAPDDAPTDTVPVTTEAAAPAPVASADVLTDPITAFQFYDNEGALEIPANVKFSFNAGGKEYKDLRVDEVVRMAQQAPMAAKHQEEINTLRPIAEQAQQAVQAYQQVQAELERNNALYEMLLTNPDLYNEAAGAFQQQNSPEQRLARLQAQQRDQQQAHQQQIQQINLQQTVAAAQHFTATRIAPSVDALAAKYPQIDADDVNAKFHQLTAPLMRPSPNGGMWVPPQSLVELEASVIPQLAAWAEAKATKTAASTKAATALAADQVKKAQIDAQLAKRQLTRPLTPLGSAPRPDVPKPIPIKSAGDAVEAALARARASIQTQGAA